MSVPVRRQTHGKTRRRRAHHALKAIALAVCSKCKKPVQPHHVCSFCGTYAKKQVLSTARAAERALKKARAKTAIEQAEETVSAEEKKAQVAEGKNVKNKSQA